MPKVLIAPTTLAGLDGPHLQLLRDAGFEIVYPKVKKLLTEEELLTELEGISASVAGTEPYTPRVLDAHPQLRVIARSGVGYDAVDVPAASARNVAVCTTPGTNQDAVSEHAFALMLACAKNLVQQDIGTRAGKWPRGVTLPLRGCTLGIAGLGRIGKSVAVRGAAFGMKLIAFEPYQDKEFAQKYGVGFVTWEELLAQSDYLSLHVPMSEESKHIINKKSLDLMKPTAFLINTSRGGLVCETDLLAALNGGRIAGAGLDVFEIEPAYENPLFALENVVITPHAAGVDQRSREEMAYSSSKAIVELSKGNWPAEQIVNGEIRKSFEW